MLHLLRGREVSRRTVHTAYAVLRTALNQAIREQRISWNPCTAVKVESPTAPCWRSGTPEQVAAFLAHTAQAEPRLAIAFQLAAWRGLRRGEIAGLRWSDLDLDGGTLRVERNVTDVDGQVRVASPRPSAASGRSPWAPGWPQPSASTASARRPSGWRQARTGTTRAGCSLARTGACSGRSC